MTTPTDPLRAVRALADRVAAQGREIKRLQRSADLGRASIDDGALVVKNSEGVEALRIGEQEDGSTVVAYVAGPTPAAPAPPRVVTLPGGSLVVTWDGRLLGAEGQELGAPGDFLHVQIYISEDQTPDTPDEFDPATAEMVGVITSAGGGSKTIGRAPGRYEVRLVAVSRSGQESAPSDPVEADVERLSDAPDLAYAMGDLDDRLVDARDKLEQNDAALADLGTRFSFSDRAPEPDDAEGRSEGSVWTQLGPGTESGVTLEVGRWQLRAGVWVPMGLDPTIIPELLGWLATFQQVNVGQLVATDAAMKSATVLKLFAEIFAAKKISAREIEAGSVSVLNMTVGSTDNLHPDPTFVYPDQFTTTSGVNVTFPRTGGYKLGPAIVVPARGGQAGAYSPPIGSEPSAAYSFSMWVKSTVAQPAGAASLYLRHEAANGTGAVVNMGSAPAMVANAWYRITGQATLPADTAIARVKFGGYVQATAATGTFTFSDPVVTRMMTGSLVVNGAIDGQTIRGAELIGGTVTMEGTGAGAGYNISLSSSAAGGRVTWTVPGSSNPAYIRSAPAGSASGFSYSAGMEISSNTTAALPQPGVIRLFPTASGGRGAVHVDGNLSQVGTSTFLNSTGFADFLATRAVNISSQNEYVTVRGTSATLLADSVTATVMNRQGGNSIDCFNNGTIWLVAGGTGRVRLASGPNELSIDNTATLVVGRLRNQDTYDITTGTSANMVVTTNGYYARTSSTEENKLERQPLEREQIEALLEVVPITWWDRGDAERLADHESLVSLGVLTEEQQAEAAALWDRTEALQRIPGVTAEALEAAGATRFVIYKVASDGTRRPVGVAYDRIAAALLPIIKELREQATQDRARITALEEQMAALTAQVAALVAGTSTSNGGAQ